MQKDGKAKEVANPIIKRTSSVRRVPPPPPPRPEADGSAEDGSDGAAVAQPAEEDQTSTSPTASPAPGAGRVVRMVGKRRASLQKMAHNNAAAAASEQTSTVSGEQSPSEDGEGATGRDSIDSASVTPSKSVLKGGITPPQRVSEDSNASPAGGLRKSLSRGVSFASDVKER
jgi:hypothetical protein